LINAKKKSVTRAGLITDFKGSCLDHVIIRPGHFGLTTKRRSNKGRTTPVALIMTIIFCEKSIIIIEPDLQEIDYELDFIIHSDLFVKLYFS